MLRLSMCALLLVSTIFTAPARAQSLKNDEILSSITVSAVAPPRPVLGADNRIHLAYELLATNMSGLFVTLDEIDLLNQDGKMQARWSGSALDHILVDFARKGRVLPPGVAAMIVLDVTLPPNAALPASLAPRISATRAAVGPDGSPKPLGQDSPFTAHYSFTGPAVQVSAVPAITVAPPMRGNNWVAGNGCCETATAHRGTALAVNGTLYVPQRFAIDWVKLDDQNHNVTGDPTQLTSYPCFGAPIYSATDGVVVNLYDSAPEQVPEHPVRIRPENIGGNMIVVSIGNGEYAFYGHLQPGSLKVKLGDHVQAGQMIGLLGNSGNSTGPHLHFEIMDGPSPLKADGLPFVFAHFSSPGVVVGDLDDVSGAPMQIDTSRLAGAHANQLPLDNQVVDFN